MVECAPKEIEHPALTRREAEVLSLVAYGYSAKEIASLIQIAPRTVERHTENLRLKLRARNRAHLITLAILGCYLEIDSSDRHIANPELFPINQQNSMPYE